MKVYILEFCPMMSDFETPYTIKSVHSTEAGVNKAMQDSNRWELTTSTRQAFGDMGWMITEHEVKQ